MRYALNEEKWTGNSWIDGKKIYRYSFQQQLPNNGNVETDLSNLNIDSIVNIGGISVSPTYTVTLPYVSVQANQQSIGIEYYQSTKKIRLVTGVNRSDNTGYITVEYTKHTEGSES